MTERWTAGAAQDYRWFRARDSRIAARIDRLIEEIKRRPSAGIGKPEPLRGTLTGWWSRRITGEHRLVYRVVGKGASPRRTGAAPRMARPDVAS
jgi:toxin YoeB